MKKYIQMIPILLVSGTLGYFGGMYIATAIENGDYISLFLMFFFLGLSYFFQLVFHEAGHLLFGLLTGYEFLSFRIGSFIVQKEDGRYRIRKMNLAGTAGQCILIAPELKNGTYPFILYNLGGILVNLILFMINYLLSMFVENNVLYLFFVTNAFSAILMFVTNGIPVKIGGVATDGYNTYALLKDKDAADAFWKQLKINEYQTKGVRLKDMDADLFEIKGNQKNILISTILVFKENRMMDVHEFDQAKELIQYLLSDSVQLMGLYENLLKNDLMYISLLHHEEYSFDKNCIRFRKNMKDFPSVIRTEYAMNVSQKEEGLEELKRFEKISQSYPVKADIESERELMEIIRYEYM